ncbi:MAG: regulatory protein RecX [Bacteroidota bacterium]
MDSSLSLSEIVQKLEYYCSYQERCHVEVNEKLRGFNVTEQEKDQVIVHLIQQNFLNEERFASVFSISKFHQKKWGKIRIKNELKARKISDYLISKSIKGIPSDEYETTFQTLAEKYWDTITEKNPLKKRKKFCDFLLRKGWESDWIYEKAKKLES